MTEIYSNHDIQVRQHIDSHLFHIELTRPHPALLGSLKKMIRGSTCSDDYMLLTFKAYSVQMLKKDCKKWEICSVAHMAATLGGQLKCLWDDYSATIIGLNAEKIMVVDSCTFVSLDVEWLSEINDQKKVTIFRPFLKTDFFVSPELKKAKTLPIHVHYKTSYFSLGCLLLYVLLSYEDAFYWEYIHDFADFDKEKMESLLKKYLNHHPIKETKLYWFVARCLVEEPEKRALLFI
jgi:hypothetical protein